MAYSWAVFTFNPFSGIDVASNCSSNTGGTVASWLLVVIQCYSHQCLLPPTLLPCPLCRTHEHLPGMFRGTSWSSSRNNLSVLLCLSPLSPFSWNLWGGTLCVDGALKRPKRNAQSFSPRGTNFTAQRSHHTKAHQSGIGATQDGQKVLDRSELPYPRQSSHTLAWCECLCYLKPKNPRRKPRVVTWQLPRQESLLKCPVRC